ncbi:MAG: hypothetical protein QF457_10010, partial [SAR324 cluster bacterium]|nr:hypothetical protein [SAR324 cluster bacterium]
GCDSNGCEYMTGGNIAILGNVGDNFAAGMTGCGKSPELENYERCVELLNHERKEARKSQNYSYDSQRFLECRAPVQYGS